MLLGVMEIEEGQAQAADRLGFLLLKWDMKLPLLFTRALLTFIRPLKKANATRPRGKWSVCFVLNTLLTDCRVGMVRWAQTDCRPGHSPPCPTLVPLCESANKGFTILCPHQKTYSPRDKARNKNKFNTQSSLTDNGRR